jgi:hypothetical protein
MRLFLWRRDDVAGIWDYRRRASCMLVDILLRQVEQTSGSPVSRIRIDAL